MEIIKESDFRKEIKTAPRSAYVFFGEEDYMKSFAMKKAIEAICPEESFAFFNEIRIDAFTYSPSVLLDALMPLPMMAERKLIAVTGLDISAMRQNEVEDLCAVLAQLEEYDYNTVIINVASDRLDPGTLPKRPSTLLKRLGEVAVLVNFEKNTPSKLAAWVEKHFEHNGVSASPQVCALVIERCGRDMFNLSNETDKLSFYVKADGRNVVTADDVKAVATPVSEYDTFAFANAISTRKKDEALDILRDLKMRKVDPIFIMGDISKNICEMAAVSVLKADGLTYKEVSDILGIHEYRVSLIFKINPRVEICRSMVSRCREADMEIKNSRDGFAVIEKLICTI